MCLVRLYKGWGE